MVKAQMSQIFTYILIIIVIGALIIVGYKGILSILKSKCDTDAVMFEKSITDAVEAYSDKGSVRTMEFVVPCKARLVCFANATINSGFGPALSALDLDQSYKDAITSAVNDQVYNTFVIGEDFIPVGYFSSKQIVPEHIFCAEITNGKIKLVFSGLGRATQIEAG